MTDDTKKHPEEPDPLSATAMFFRALDQQSESAQPKSAPANSEPAGSGINLNPTEPSPLDSKAASSKGEFTEIFGKPTSAQPTAGPSLARSAAAASQSPGEPLRFEAESPGKQPPGEFTRIFVKDVSPPSAKPVSKPVADHPETVPSAARPRGFSTPGTSNAASADTSFTQMFKPGASPASAASGTPVQPVASPFRHETPSAGISPRTVPGEMPLSRPNEAPKTAQPDQSITSFIESLSSPAAPASGPRMPEPVPYRPDPLASYQPVAKPAAPSEFESGGVTRFIQRLSDPAPAPAAPPLAPVREVQSGEGEFTRIISAPFKAPGSASPVSAAPAPSAPAAPPFPAMPAAPAFPAVHAPVAPVVAASPAPAPHAAAMPPIPAPHLPPMPAPPRISAPKGKLEALVPMLLVVNTFLLVIILVVMIFLIRAR